MAENSFGEHTKIERAYSLFFFIGNYKNIIHLIKYRDHPGLGYYFGRILGHKIAESCNDDFSLLPDKIVPVPLHPLRWLKRGYNQAAEIARGISKGIDDLSGRKIEVSNAYIKRVHITATQTRKNKEDRRLNMIAAFRPKSRGRWITAILGLLKFQKDIMNHQPGCNSMPQTEQEHEQIHFLIVDDVFTTGATLEAAIHALRSSPSLFNCKVSIATLAYVE